MPVVASRTGGIIRRVRLLDDAGAEVAPVARFLDHLTHAGYSPNTVLAYAYDLQHLARFLAGAGLTWAEFRPATALAFLAHLRQVPRRKTGDGLCAATVRRVLAAASSFFEWAIAAEVYPAGAHPLHRPGDLPSGAPRGRRGTLRWAVRVRVPVRLPRPLAAADVDALLAATAAAAAHPRRDRAILLLMLDGGLRPGEVLCLQLGDVAYGRRRVTVPVRDDHPRGARAKARRERVVDLHAPRTLEAVSAYVLRERPAHAASPFVFLVGGAGPRRGEPLSYQAVVRGFARRLTRLGLRAPGKTPHALRHTHATAMWEGGMRELALQARLGHTSPESTRAYTRVSDAQVLAEYRTALQSRTGGGAP